MTIFHPSESNRFIDTFDSMIIKTAPKITSFIIIPNRTSTHFFSMGTSMALREGSDKERTRSCWRCDKTCGGTEDDRKDEVDCKDSAGEGAGEPTDLKSVFEKHQKTVWVWETPSFCTCNNYGEFKVNFICSWIFVLFSIDIWKLFLELHNFKFAN